MAYRTDREGSVIDLAADVQSYLIAEGLVDGATGWPSTRGRVHDETERLVAVASDVGPAPEAHAAEGLGSAALTIPSVQVRVRGAAADTRDEINTKARAIYDALHSLQGETLGSTAYMQIAARASAFAEFYDDRERLNLTMSYLAYAAAVA
jgi:hypothetical protein